MAHVGLQQPVARNPASRATSWSALRGRRRHKDLAQSTNMLWRKLAANDGSGG